MYDWLDQYDYFISSADTFELVGDSPDLAAGINEDALVVQWADWRSEPGLWVHFRDLVSRVTFRSRLDVEIFLRGIAWDFHKKKLSLISACCMRLSWYHVGFCLLVFDIIQSDLIFSMVDESLDRLSHSQYRDRAESLDALFNTRTCGSFRQSSEWFDVSGEVRGINVFCLIVAW